MRPEITALIKQYAEDLNDIHEKGTQGDYTYVGFLYTFAVELLEEAKPKVASDYPELVPPPEVDWDK